MEARPRVREARGSSGRRQLGNWGPFRRPVPAISVPRRRVGLAGLGCPGQVFVDFSLYTCSRARAGTGLGAVMRWRQQKDGAIRQPALPQQIKCWD